MLSGSQLRHQEGALAAFQRAFEKAVALANWIFVPRLWPRKARKVWYYFSTVTKHFSEIGLEAPGAPTLRQRWSGIVPTFGPRILVKDSIQPSWLLLSSFVCPDLLPRKHTLTIDFRGGALVWWMSCPRTGIGSETNLLTKSFPENCT